MSLDIAEAGERAQSPLTATELFEAGREARASLPRSAQGDYSPRPAATRSESSGRSTRTACRT
ncbi:hypothetical protein [Leifsonia xyli]|uniref:hypothetical protein n=1 Tax=Leifsonia xyli TaxID=1575 RepID=UPI003D668102